MTANSPITMQDLVDGFVLIDSDEGEWHVQQISSDVCYLEDANENRMNTVSLSSDGLTISFGGDISQGTNFTGFTFNA